MYLSIRSTDMEMPCLHTNLLHLPSESPWFDIGVNRVCFINLLCPHLNLHLTALLFFHHLESSVVVRYLVLLKKIIGIKCV